MYTPPPPPPSTAVHAQAPTAKAAENSIPYGQKRVSGRRIAIEDLFGFDPFIFHSEIQGSPMWYGRNQSKKHTNRLHKRKQAKLRAKRNGK